MKMLDIVKMEAWRVFVPMLEEWAYSPEYHGNAPDSPSLILKVEDGEGRCGYGEGITGLSGDALRAALGHFLEMPAADQRGQCLDLHAQPTYWHLPLAPAPRAPDLANLQHRIRHPLQAAVECAWLDLIARRAGVPLSALFGGAWRDRVAVDYWMDRVTPEHARRCVARGRAIGFTGVKLKTSLEDENVERLEAILAEGGPDWHVTVDSNGRFYRLDDALPTITAMDAVGNMRILEDPFPSVYLADFAALRPRIRARVVVHAAPGESLHAVIASGAAGGLNLSSHTHGFFGWRMGAAVAGAFNLPVWQGTNLDLGIATAAQLHLSAATPNCQLPGDQSGPWLRQATLVREPFTVVNGHVLVPPGPGHGVTFDPDAAERYTLDHFVLTRKGEPA